MRIIGLCGGSGSGKGTVANAFLKYGIPSIDTDAVYHEITSSQTPGLDALVDDFGTEILTADRKLDRKKLSSIVFVAENAGQKREKLNSISHKYVLENTRDILSKYESDGYKAALVDAPLLFESGFDKECDLVIAVVSDISVRISRITARDGIDENTARLRISTQLADEFLRQKADFVIENSGDLSELEAQVKSIAAKILS